MLVGRYSKTDIIDTALFRVGYGVIDNELQKYAPNAIDMLYKESLNFVNLYIPEIREETLTPVMGTSRNASVVLPTLYRDGRTNDPSAIVDVTPTGMSFRERNFDQVMGQVNFNSIMYTFDPGFDQMLFENLRTRRRIYGVDFKFRQDKSNPFRVFMDDISAASANQDVNIVYLNKWNPDERTYTNGTVIADLINFIAEEPGSHLIDLLTARIKEATGAIRRKLSGGNRAAVLDGEALASEGTAEVDKAKEAIMAGALLVAYRQE